MITSNLERLVTRSRGVFVGAAVGDALGWPQEQNSNAVGGNQNRIADPQAHFHAWNRYAGSRQQRYVDPVGAGEYSDDTQLILATARAIQTDDWFAALTNCELPLFLLYQRGAGGATLRSCRSWADGSPPWVGGSTEKARRAQQQYFSAGGNGVAMRIAPHVIACAADGRRELVSRVVRDGVATHGHPRALVGAAAYAIAMHLLLTTDNTLEYGELTQMVSADKSWQNPDIALRRTPNSWTKAADECNPDLSAWWLTAVKETLALLTHAQRGIEAGVLVNDSEILDMLGCFDRRVNGAGTVSGVGAIYLASRNAPRPMNGLLRAAFLKKADSDTLASMTAGLLGALHGSEWLGSLAATVQDLSYLNELADECTKFALGGHRNVRSVKPVHHHDLNRFRNALVHGTVGIFPDGRDLTNVQVTALESKTSASAQRWILSVGAQTVIVDAVERGTAVEKESNSPAYAPGTPKPPKANARFRLISLLTSDLDAIEKFYGEEGFGLETSRLSDTEIIVAKFLRFVSHSQSRNVSARPVLFDIQVSDIDWFVDKLSATKTDDRTARIKDPCGNDIRIIESQN